MLVTLDMLYLLIITNARMYLTIILFTGHINCKKNSYSKRTMNPRLGKTMGDLEIETKRWERRVKDCGYKLVTKYECGWTDEVAADTSIQEHLKEFNLSNPITPRSALYGGRTEAICLHAVGSKAEPIKYIDVVRTKINSKLHIFVLLSLLLLVLFFFTNIIIFF